MVNVFSAGTIQTFFVRQVFFLLPLCFMLLGVHLFLDGRSQVEVFSSVRPANPLLTAFLKWFSLYGNYLFYAVYLMLIAFSLKSGRTDFGWLVLYYVVVQVVITLISIQLLKFSLGRPRPFTGETEWAFFSTQTRYHSLPSGHTAEVIAAAGPFAHMGRTVLGAVALGVFPAVMGFSRIYLCKHFPTDVFAGALLGSVSAYCIVTLWQRKKRSLSRNAHKSY